MPPRKGAPPWAKIRHRAEKGEDPKALARNFKVTLDDLRAVATDQGWAVDWLHEPEAASPVNGRTHETVKGTVAQSTASYSLTVREAATPQDYQDQHLDDWQTLRRVVDDELQAWGTRSPTERAKLLHSIAGAMKLVQDGQRKALGLEGAGGPLSPDDDKPAIDTSNMDAAELARHYREAIQGQ